MITGRTLVGVKQLAYILALQRCSSLNLTGSRIEYMERRAQKHDELKNKALDTATQRILRLDSGEEILLITGTSHPKAKKSIPEEMGLIFSYKMASQIVQNAINSARLDIFVLIKSRTDLKGYVFELKTYPMHKVGTGDYVQTLMYTLLLKDLFGNKGYTCKIESDRTLCVRDAENWTITAEIHDPFVAPFLGEPFDVEGYLVTIGKDAQFEFLRIDTRGLDLVALMDGLTVGLGNKYVITQDCNYCSQYVNRLCKIFFKDRS